MAITQDRRHDRETCDDDYIITCVTLPGLRHAFATHLLEQREDIRVIQVLLGHQKLDNTARYTQVATKALHQVKGPLEYLDLQPTG